MALKEFLTWFSLLLGLVLILIYPLLQLFLLKDSVVLTVWPLVALGWMKTPIIVALVMLVLMIGLDFALIYWLIDPCARRMLSPFRFQL